MMLKPAKARWCRECRSYNGPLPPNGMRPRPYRLSDAQNTVIAHVGNTEPGRPHFAVGGRALHGHVGGRLFLGGTAARHKAQERSSGRQRSKVNNARARIHRLAVQA